MLAGIGVEVDDFTIGKADSEAFLNEHVAFFIFREAGLATTAALGRGRLLESALVIEELRSLSQVDRSARLPGCLVVGCELGAF